MFALNSCGGFKYAPARDVPVKGEDRARKNIEEGRGVSIGDLRRGGTTYEFSTSNPMWRASLETLDFLTSFNSRLFWRNYCYRLVFG